MTENLLLETHLKSLRLPTFLANYRKFAEEAAQAGHSCDRSLLALADQEVARRKRNRIARRIRGARFPVLKELADFDFSCISSPSKQRVVDLARGAYIKKAESIIMVGNPRLAKTHVATAIALAACRQGLKVRFYNAAIFFIVSTSACTVHRPSSAVHEPPGPTRSCLSVRAGLQTNRARFALAARAARR